MTSDGKDDVEEAVTMIATGVLGTSADEQDSTAHAASDGASVGGRYELLALVGAGAMGTVYRALDTELDEIVALKMLNNELVGHPTLLQRFRGEVKLTRRIAHPNVARVHDIGEHQGRKFLTMEFIEGESLAALIARDSPLPLVQAIRLGTGICAGMEAAHAAGIVHRDLKPENVMVNRDGNPVITDFGIARAASEAAGIQTQLGAVLGTPAYMAPEQVEGLPDVDRRADIYAFGVLLFELLTGELPFKGETVYLLAGKRLTEPPPDPRSLRPDIPPNLGEIVLTCMARHREDRYPSALDVSGALAEATPTLRVGAIPAAKPSLPPPLPQSDERAVAVLPFRNSGKPDDAYLAEGLTEDLIDTLSMTRGLRVRPYGMVAQQAAGDVDPLDFGKRLGVEVVVSGSVRRRGDQLRVSARIVTVVDGFQLWAQRFERAAADALVVSDEVAAAVARALTVDTKRGARVAPTDPYAIELYLRGKAEARGVGVANYQRALELFQQAHERAPNDVTILAAYARVRAKVWFFEANEGERQAVYALTEKATRLEPDNADALLVQAGVLLADGEILACLKPLSRALRLAPAAAAGHELLGRIQAEVGPAEDSVRSLRRTAELDPLSDTSHLELARLFALLGRWDEARAAAQRVSPDSQNILATVLARHALWGGGLEPVQDLLAQLPGPEVPGPSYFVHLTVQVMESRKIPHERVSQIRAFAEQSGRPRRFRTLLLQLWSELAAAAGEAEWALAALENAADAGLVDNVWLELAPSLDAVREHARFTAVHKRVAAAAQAIRDALPRADA